MSEAILKDDGSIVLRATKEDGTRVEIDITALIQKAVDEAVHRHMYEHHNHALGAKP